MRVLFSLLIGIACYGSARAQVFSSYTELGLMGGVSYYLGDLNPSRQFFMVRPGGGLLFRYSPGKRWNWRINAMYMSVQADDARSDNAFQVMRNLSFRSAVLEASGLVEFNFFNYEIGNPSTPATPFIFGGLALFRYNPKAELNDEWIALQPIGTEGQGTIAYPDRTRYSLIGFSLPFGIGFKAHFLNRFSIAVEWGMRKTFLDYLDDVSTTYADPDVLFAVNGPIGPALADRSLVAPGKANTGRQRGDLRTRDWYSFAGLTLSYKLVPKKPDCAAYN